MWFFISLTRCTQCYSENGENKNPICPVCQPYLNDLAETLPFAHCSQSRLYCNISGLPMNENNQPMMLPNGHIYGEQVRITVSRFLSYRWQNLWPFNFFEVFFIILNNIYIFSKCYCSCSFTWIIIQRYISTLNTFCNCSLVSLDLCQALKYFNKTASIYMQTNYIICQHTIGILFRG